MNQSDEKTSPFDTLLIKWVNEFPIDYIWRKKYKIPFGSKQHLENSHLYMFFDLREEKLMRLSKIRAKEDAEKIENDELGFKVNKAVSMSTKEIDDEFDNLDISEFE